jgi:hypothetical protein
MVIDPFFDRGIRTLWILLAETVNEKHVYQKCSDNDDS